VQNSSQSELTAGASQKQSACIKIAYISLAAVSKPELTANV